MPILFLLFLTIFFTGCQKFGPKKYADEIYPVQNYANEAYAQEAYNYDMAEGDYFAPQGQSISGALARSEMDKRASTKQEYKNKKQMQTNRQEQKPAARMISYNGYANLHVARPEETIEAIVDIAKKYEGAIERRSTQSITIRVPKDSFSTAFKEVIGLGEVLNKSVTSEDVTEAFTSVELRLQTAKTTRDRLLALLEKTDDEEDKMKILRQLQRLNEQIDVIEAQMRTLQNLAEHSSISVDLTARKAIANGSQQVEAQGFSWIHNLSPFQNTVCHSGKRLELDTPPQFVSLHPKGTYIAESADGTTIRATRLSNQPRGSSLFWQQAIQNRLASGFGKVEQTEIGSFQTIALYEDSENPYIWIIAVQDTGKYLQLIEAYFPNTEQYERHKASVFSAIEGGAQ